MKYYVDPDPKRMSMVWRVPAPGTGYEVFIREESTHWAKYPRRPEAVQALEGPFFRRVTPLELALLCPEVPT